MIFSNMAYPGKDYRVQVFDAWLGETFEPMDNPKDGDKIVKRTLGSDGQPVVSETKVYSNGEWAEEGSGGGGGGGGGGDFETIFGPAVIPTYKAGDNDYSNDDDVSLLRELESRPSGIIVTFNGSTYIMGLVDDIYGAPYDELTSTYDYTDYPIIIYFSETANGYGKMDIHANVSTVELTIQIVSEE